jgi:hypothetical protein
MDLISTRAFAATVVVPMVLACSNKAETERKEYRAFRAQLLRISKTPTAQLGEELDRLEDIGITTERIASCRDTCLSAYRAIDSAGAKSRQAQAIISALETAEEDDPELLEKKQEKALLLLKESESDLESAKELKDRCHDLLDDLEGEGLDRNR